MEATLDSQGVSADLPGEVTRVLADFVEGARLAFGADLRSVVLYGSAAEGQLRPTSDVNVIVVLAAFDAPKADALRETLRTAYAAVRLTAMFLLDSEVAAAVEAFAVKFADVIRRRKLLHGTDPFAAIQPSRAAEITRLRQVLLNLSLRLRQQYVLSSLREEQIALIVADAAAPLRAAAAAVLELEGKPVASPKQALEAVVRTLPGSGWDDLLRHMSDARATRALKPGDAQPALVRLMDLAQQLRARAEGLR